MSEIKRFRDIGEMTFGQMLEAFGADKGTKTAFAEMRAARACGVTAPITRWPTLRSLAISMPAFRRDCASSIALSSPLRRTVTRPSSRSWR